MFAITITNLLCPQFRVTGYSHVQITSLLSFHPTGLQVKVREPSLGYDWIIWRMDFSDSEWKST